MKKLFALLFIFMLFVFIPSVKSVHALDCSGAYKGTVGCRFGTISPPPALQGFLKGDTTGAGGISQFLSNLVALFYTMAAVALVFMLVWGAFEWMTSGGSKEAVEKARNRIISAIIAIILLAGVFAILNVLGTFTGFKFFASPPCNQKSVYGENPCP